MIRSPFRPGFLVALLLLVFVAASTVAEAEEYLIGFIDSERIFAQYQGTKEAQKAFNDELERLSKELEDRKGELERLIQEYESQSLILSEPRRRERDEEIQRKRNELDAFAQEVWGPSGRVARRNEELTRPIIEQMNQVLTRLGEEEGFSIIFDAADGNVVYADRALDLTDRILAELNAQE